MHMLEEFHPLTNSGHILSGNIRDVVPQVKSVIEKLNSRAGLVHPPSKVGLNLYAGLNYLRYAVDGPFPSRFLLLPCTTSATILFNNAWRSQGWFEFAFVLTKQFELEDVFFRLQPNTIRKSGAELRGQYGAHQLVRVAQGEVRRSISLVNDGGRWVFSTQGDPCPFEDLSQYSLRKTSERFTRETMGRYLAAMGMNPFREEFYAVNAGQPAVGIEVQFTEPRELSRVAAGKLEDFQVTYGPFD